MSIARLVSNVFRVPMVVITSRRGEDFRVESAVGISPDDVPDGLFLNHQASPSEDPVVVTDIAGDERIDGSRLISRIPGIKFYAECAIMAGDSKVIGTLGLMDTHPGLLDDREREILRELVGMIRDQMLFDRMDDITCKTRETENRLRQLSEAVEQSPVSVVITDTTGTIEYVNPKFTQVTGYTASEVLGKNPRLLKSGLQSDHVYRDMWKTISQGGVWRGEFANRRKDGKLYWENASISPVINDGGKITNYIAVKEDITDIKRVNDEMSILAKFSSDNPNPVIRVDRKGRILYVNRSGESLLDSWETGVGNRLSDAFTGFIDDVFITGKSVEIEHRVGEQIFRLLFSPVITGDYLYVYGENITDRKRAEKLKDEFVSIVSHELRTPLTSIRGSLGLLDGGVIGTFSEEAQELIRIALKNCERLELLINDILDVEKIESGNMEFKMKRVDMNSLVSQAVESSSSYARSFDIAITFHRSEDPAYVWVDPDRFIQIVTNLLSNAVKFSPSGDRVEVSVRKENGQSILAVDDFGPGIPEEYRNRIFQKFTQVDSSNTRARGGTGLGLSIARALVERMNGTIDFETAVGRGTSFHVRFPGAEIGQAVG